jgi:hypothetical protein
MLFWFTISMIALVAIVAVVTILSQCSGIVRQMGPALAIIPGEVGLCPGEQRQFVVEGGNGVTWEATGGTVTQSGLYTAAGIPGDYAVTVTGERQEAVAVVHVVLCTPTATPVLPTMAPTDTPAAGVAPADAQGDVGAYEGGGAVAGVPSGLDINSASVGGDMRVILQPTAGVPAELEGWAGGGDALLWISLYDAIPNPPSVYTEWLFSLDLDGNTGTGRAAGSARINPGLGDDVVVGVSYNPASTSFEPFFYVWQGSWVSVPNVVQYRLNGSRTLVGLSFSMETLAQNAAVSTVPDGVRGRAASTSYVGEQRVIDLYPE